MRREAVTQKSKTDRMVKDIRRKTRKKHSSEDKIRIVLEGLRGEDSIGQYVGGTGGVNGPEPTSATASKCCGRSPLCGRSR